MRYIKFSLVIAFLASACLSTLAFAQGRSNAGLSQLDALGDAVDGEYYPSPGMFWTPDEAGTGIAFEIVDGLVFGAYYNYNPDGTQAYQVFSGTPVINDWYEWGDTGVMATMEATIATTQGGVCLECSGPEPYDTTVLPDKAYLTWYSPRRVLIEYKGTTRLMTPTREIAPGSTVADLMTSSSWRRFEVRSIQGGFVGDPVEHNGVVLKLEPRTDDEKWYFHLDTSVGNRVGPYWVNLPSDSQLQYKWVCQQPAARLSGQVSDDKDRCLDIFPEGFGNEPGRAGHPNEIVWQDSETGEFFGIRVIVPVSANPECPATQEVIGGREITRLCVDDYTQVFAYHAMNADRMVRRSWYIATDVRADETYSRHIDRIDGPDQFFQRMPLNGTVRPQETWK